MNKSKSSLFLMELILAILIFAITSAICIQIFVKAHIVSQETQELNQSVTLCTSAAELFYGYDGNLSKIQKQLDGLGLSEAGTGSLTLYYDKDFMLCTKADGMYELSIINAKEDNLLNSDISIRKVDDTEDIYFISCSLFVENNV